MNPYAEKGDLVIYVTTDESKNRYHFGDVGESALYKIHEPDNNGNMYVLSGGPSRNCSGTWMNTEKARKKLARLKERQVKLISSNQMLIDELEESR